jgi:tRNA pseudouridine32 synthase/23S rRNA pseudouridine746 synthase
MVGESPSLSADQRARIEASFTSRRWCWEIADGEACAGTCLEELVVRLPHIAVRSWGARFEMGGVYLAGKPAQPDNLLAPPCRLEYYEPHFDVAEGVVPPFPRFDPSSVLFCDEDVGVVCKPPGLPTTAPRDQIRFNLVRYLCDHLGRSVHVPSRLDVGVGGVMLFSLSERMNRHLQKAYEKRSVERYYLAELPGVVGWSECEVTVRIARDQRHAVLRRPVAQGGENAHTKLNVLDSYVDVHACSTSVIQAQPFTGRTHQIRVHCLAAARPIIGDPFYWESAHGTFDAGGIRLASCAVRFYHPYKRELMTFELPKAHGIKWLHQLEGIRGRPTIQYGDRRNYEGRTSR